MPGEASPCARLFLKDRDRSSTHRRPSGERSSFVRTENQREVRVHSRFDAIVGKECEGPASKSACPVSLSVQRGAALGRAEMAGVGRKQDDGVIEAMDLKWPRGRRTG